MKLKQLFTDDSAVSPVIGVILMVAITVILAAVIGTFVLNLGGSVSQTTPQASFGFNFEDGTTDNVTITHETGATIPADQLSLKTDVGVDVYLPGSAAETGDNVTQSEAFTDTDAFSEGASVSAGDTLIAEGSDLKGGTFRVVWNAETGESSATLSEYTAPSN
ncbi:type IV pilin N-terminal domain-containing protein [Halogeometricum sp. S1BR25-6]|uniref:Type IV pilin N-terminal domain-containing protein n=1 Tax=Halogeometricum salsisoli TaxID=2950536 RepID=A0ABU2GF57_9EURY|nr:type IV pilin N-terminal domain-containing protein [Halogeometricum sp. S1BR25-6]MDS0299441.1 type IV pilin N-terminal domain-containing protein [Halogeometricum sp. S1BR25-6]